MTPEVIAAMVASVRANAAWSYAEHRGLGDFYQRSALCAHADFLTAKALALIDGSTFDRPYHGAKQMIVWPVVALEESDETSASALVDEVLRLLASDLASECNADWGVGT